MWEEFSELSQQSNIFCIELKTHFQIEIVFVILSSQKVSLSVSWVLTFPKSNKFLIICFFLVPLMFRASLLSSLQSSKKILKNEYFHFHGEINTSSLFYRQPHFNPRFFLPSRGIFHFNQPKRKRRFSWELPDSKPPPVRLIHSMFAFFLLTFNRIQNQILK
jgi:hypothetical protein